MDMQGHCAAGHGKGWYKLIGRVFLGAVFFIAGLAKIVGFSGATGMIGQAGFPVPALFTVLAIIFEFGGAILLITGFHVRTGAWMLIVFTGLVTAIFHNPADGQMAALMFEKNLAIVGGLLYVAATGAGRYSLAKWNRKYCKGGNMCLDCRTCPECDHAHAEAPAAQGEQQHQEHQHQEHHEHQPQWS